MGRLASSHLSNHCNDVFTEVRQTSHSFFLLDRLCVEGSLEPMEDYPFYLYSEWPQMRQLYKIALYAYDENVQDGNELHAVLIKFLAAAE